MKPGTTKLGVCVYEDHIAFLDNLHRTGADMLNAVRWVEREFYMPHSSATEIVKYWICEYLDDPARKVDSF